MSDSAYIDEYVTERAAFDRQFAARQAAIILGASVEADLRDNATIRALIGALEDDRNEAVYEITRVSPENKDRIIDLVVRLRAVEYVRSWLGAIIRRGQDAAQAIHAEQEAQSTDWQEEE